MTTTTDTPRIYVACLASYNNGILHGAWIDATDEDEMEEGIKAMLKAGPIPNAEEWAIHGFDFKGVRLSEHESIEKIAELAQAIEEHGEAYALYADNVGLDYATVENFEDIYAGDWESEKDFGENLFDELYAHEIPDHLQNYIDYESFSHDLFMGDYYSLTGNNGECYVYHNQ